MKEEATTAGACRRSSSRSSGAGGAAAGDGDGCSAAAAHAGDGAWTPQARHLLLVILVLPQRMADGEIRDYPSPAHGERDGEEELADGQGR